MPEINETIKTESGIIIEWQENFYALRNSKAFDFWKEEEED
jgi:hypothetical protein